MKLSLFRGGLILSLFMTACSQNGQLSHHGQRLNSEGSVELDSIMIDADTTSLRGNFVMMDSSLMFVDQHYCKIYAFSLDNGKLRTAYSGYGRGPNEMMGILYGSVVHPADTAMWIFDSSNGVYEFTPSNGEVRFKDKIDFSWGSSPKGDYSSPSCYNVMQMSDFGLTLTQIDDSTVLMPVSLMNRSFDGIEKERYSKGHIFAGINRKDLNVNALYGTFPSCYSAKPLPFFEFFDYAVDSDNGLIYTSHAPDSLIYCHDMHGNAVGTLGFEPEGVNRDYTSGLEVSPEVFKNDISHVGVNTGMYYDNQDGLLFRTSMTDFPTGTVVMQVYKDNNLVLEQAMPSYFKLLGKYSGRYYGVRFIPVDDGNTSHFVLYRFTMP